MKISVLLIAGDNKRFIAVAIEAANAVFPGSSVSSIGSFKEALDSNSGSPELLVINDADGTTIQAAVQALDSHKLPRWAVVAMGSSDPVPFAEVIPEGDWNPSLLSRVFRSAVALHMMHRERERLRGDLLSIGIRISHDLRTPVGGIVSSTEVLDGSLTVPPQGERSLTQPVYESANDLVKIIGQLSLVSKASARPDMREHFNMATPVGRALERVQMKVRDRSASVSNPKAWPEAIGDPTYSEAIWVGLVDNALRHSGKAPTIELGWEQQADGNRFWVRDNGDGVPMAKRRSLFQPFHRLHEPSAPRGLGLPIVERLAAVQGGHAGYEPGTPAGSLFYFTLPR